MLPAGLGILCASPKALEMRRMQHQIDYLRHAQGDIYEFDTIIGSSGALAQVPTWREQGFDAVVSNSRTFLGAKSMTPAQLAYWDRVFKRLSESAEWKKELEENFWTSEFLPSAEARKQMDRDDAQLRAFLKELALTK